MRSFRCLALLGACAFGTSVAHAQPSVLIAASDPAQITELEVAKVAAADASVWLSVRLGGSASLAIVASAARVEPATAADAWLRALDFSTRVRVTPPPGPLAACTGFTGNSADSGFPEPLALLPTQVSTLASEIELRRSLADAGLTVDLARISAFTAGASAPFRFSLYRTSDAGGDTAAMRFSDSGPALGVPGVAAAGRDSVPVTLLTLASTGVLPVAASVSDPSQFAVRYFGASASTDYVKARAAWLAEDSTRWLVEARASSALSAYTVIPGAGEIEPGIAHYLDASPGQRDARACFAAVQAALARGSRQAADFACAAGDDLEQSLSELDFSAILLTRTFGSLAAAGVALRASDAPEQSPELVATDFDAQGCPAPIAVPPASGSMLPPGASSAPDPRSTSGTSVDSSSEQSSTSADSGGCAVTVSTDSCSGDSSGADGSNDSCSGDSSSGSDSSSSDSCSGDSSSDSSSSDSCSGDSSSSSSDDSSGCGKSNYDGDTCSGNSANSANPDSKTLALEPSRSRLNLPRRGRPQRRVHLSLLTLLAAMVTLPLRRKRLWRNAVAPKSA